METVAQTPESNADIVALNLVDHAIVDDINNPGESIGRLLESMAAMSRNIGGDFRAANADWQGFISRMAEANVSEIEPFVGRQELSVGDTWAQRWMLMHMAKHLYHELENKCMESPAVSAIESVTYSETGSVEAWKIRPR